MPPSATDEEILADLLLQWEEAGRIGPVGEMARKMAGRHPHLIGELGERMAHLAQMAWLDNPDPGPGISKEFLPESGPLLAGRYRLQIMLSSGWGGALYRAHDLELDREVAIKVPRTSDPLSGAHLVHEGRCASRLRHPGIVPVFDVGRDGNRVFLVYEFIQGENIAQTIARGPVSWRKALAITRQVVLAAAHAHERGVVHRDIKSANILIDLAGNALLADFGSAAPAGRENLMESLGAGAVAYTAPEILRGAEASPATDMYAIGMVLCSMLKGEGVGDDGSIAGLRETILSPAEWNPRFPEGVPGEVVRLCRGMIVKAPAERLMDPEVIRKTIDRVLAPRRRFAPWWALGLLLPFMGLAWGLAGPGLWRGPAEAAFGVEHEPSVDGTIGGRVLKLPVGLAFAPDGTILVANAARGNVCRFRRDGGLIQVFGKRGSGSGFLFYPHGIACGSDGTVYVSDHGNHVIHAYSPDGRLLAAAGGYGTDPGRFIEPHGLALDAGGRLFVGDSGNTRIQVLDRDLRLLSVISLAGQGLSGIVGVLVDPRGRLLVADTGGGCVRVFSEEGKELGKMSTGGDFQPLWLARDSRGRTWVGDGAKGVAVFAEDHRPLRFRDLEKRLSFYPQGLGFGPKGELAVVNYGANRVVMVQKVPEMDLAVNTDNGDLKPSNNP